MRAHDSKADAPDLRPVAGEVHGPQDDFVAAGPQLLALDLRPDPELHGPGPDGRLRELGDLPVMLAAAALNHDAEPRPLREPQRQLAALTGAQPVRLEAHVRDRRRGAV